MRRRRQAQEDNECPDPISVFAGKGLTVSQLWMANALLGRATRSRGPLTGTRGAKRIGGIVTAVKEGRVGNAAWGRTMLATKGGKARAKVGPSMASLSRQAVDARKKLAELHEAHELTYGERLYGFRRKS